MSMQTQKTDPDAYRARTRSLFLLYGADHAAADFGPGVPCRLRRKIVRLAVDDDRAAEDIRHLKAVGQENQKRPALTLKKRRQITCMLWVRTLSRIIMPFRIRELHTRARGSLMDVKAEHTGGTGRAAMRQAAYLGGDDDTQRNAEKRNGSPELRRIRSAGHTGDGSGTANP